MDKYTNSLPVRVVATTPAHPLTSQNTRSGGYQDSGSGPVAPGIRAESHRSAPSADTGRYAEPRDRGVVTGLRNGAF
ncbi:hypothetical protein ACQP1G_28830 [Nocardia sp. CA-107356]|uniref:hypothetical protein n=1 Tax=Nocardia sp. CA-107356 TaxID=3239972 RepID=UPI003D91B4B5